MVNFLTNNKVGLILFIFSYLSFGVIFTQVTDSVFIPRKAQGFTDSNYVQNLNKHKNHKVRDSSKVHLSSEERLNLYKRRLEILDESSDEYLQIKSKIDKIENKL